MGKEKNLPQIYKHIPLIGELVKYTAPNGLEIYVRTEVYDFLEYLQNLSKGRTNKCYFRKDIVWYTPRIAKYKYDNDIE